MDFVNEGGFACHAKLDPAPTMTVCLKKNENTSTNINTKSNSSSEKVKPVFLKDEDVFGSSMKPARYGFCE
jgi:hypothetical protein